MKYPITPAHLKWQLIQERVVLVILFLASLFAIAISFYVQGQMMDVLAHPATASVAQDISPPNGPLSSGTPGSSKNP